LKIKLNLNCTGVVGAGGHELEDVVVLVVVVGAGVSPAGIWHSTLPRIPYQEPRVMSPSTSCTSQLDGGLPL